VKKWILITISGIDGAGKSTQLKLLERYYIKQGFTPVYLWTRGGYTSGIKSVKNILRRFAGKRLPSSGNSHKRDEIFGNQYVQRIWLIIAIIDLLRVYTLQVRFWLLQGKVVICDRYIWDTFIDFQIMFPGLKVENWLLWKTLVLLTPKPSLQCLLTIPLELSEFRCAQKYDPFPDSSERSIKRYALYKEAQKLARWQVLDSARPVDIVFGDIKRLLP